MCQIMSAVVGACVGISICMHFDLSLVLSIGKRSTYVPVITHWNSNGLLE